MPESIIYSLRLPPDPPRSFDINRATPDALFEAINEADMAIALMPICKLVGLPDFEAMTHKIASPTDWYCCPANRPYWLLYWLKYEAQIRKVV